MRNRFKGFRIGFLSGTIGLLLTVTIDAHLFGNYNRTLWDDWLGIPIIFSIFYVSYTIAKVLVNLGKNE